MRVREFTDADWPRVWPIVREVIRAEDTFPYDPAWTSDQARDVWVVRAPGVTAVAEEDGRILGTGHMQSNRPGRGAHVATASFMVAGHARGRGVGRALCEHALDWARSLGYAGMQFNAVVETNTAAVNLYLDLGFTIIGTVPGAFDHPQHGRVGLHVMYIELG
ncbi:GNAT family N-acetyltransferase [Actinokineospora sp. UTMC 2448]|uniref:GNAT family N-acetyltransferase n=1 Tax=Actinokineospora sp. UTMC 2448 TaxID=2268449 RepID=UPI002164C68C|nr:GNAT family N-acetyltransferase [Actinokineospora sp. UTMC 2448]UVS79106.1 ribosomal-protein-alanine acetyltransferase [Actinokineospora sp. UTMC 2448]